jgi:hypothetical protein
VANDAAVHVRATEILSQALNLSLQRGQPSRR